MTPQQRTDAWQAAATLADAAAAFGTTTRSASEWASRMRRRGVPLRHFPRSVAAPLPVVR